MVNEQGSSTLQSDAAIEEQRSAQPVSRQGRRSLIARAADQEWAVPALLLFLDVLSWFVIYWFIGFLRRDAYYSSAFLYFVIDLLQVTVIVMSLVTIGGYDQPHGDARPGLYGGTYFGDCSRRSDQRGFDLFGGHF
jgi:hypothetical protein